MLALVVIGAALAGFVQGLSGFAFGLVALAFWAWALDPVVAGSLVVLGSLVGQLMGVPLMRLAALPRALPFIAGGALGVPLGVTLLSRVDPLLFQAGLGTLLVLWCPLMLASGKLPRITHGGRVADGVAGLAGGFMGGLAGVPGPVPTLWCTLRGWERPVQRAVFQYFNLSMHVLTTTGLIVSGQLRREALSLCLMVVPVVVVTAILGARTYRKLGDLGFQRVVLALLALSGVTMLLHSLPHLL
ncbi:sulfite exporter TauE/SafE family protein [Siccirubricoccus sp. KC 17139]|uniref:Probable membrane transporter protein n=1 Tax=Siccirubricoccus soli TaxID=2899147 RepID=A0ABT1D0R3_9PROT|nr:sulfite exporter TauE/SafE family protein [Siccirubricoccus soli]MCO6414615.1 sulfite exporter TauE/SafE family protein [Siccirubricoccus soli]MCP2680745.1 sulfite exporter TauE/SafE family protein [Siccirubricoccus soli]